MVNTPAVRDGRDTPRMSPRAPSPRTVRTMLRRAAIVRLAGEGWSLAEIGRELGISRQAVWSHFWKAMDQHLADERNRCPTCKAPKGWEALIEREYGSRGASYRYRWYRRPAGG